MVFSSLVNKRSIFLWSNFFFFLDCSSNLSTVSSMIMSAASFSVDGVISRCTIVRRRRMRSTGVVSG